MSYLKDSLNVPQSEPLDEKQVPNSAGGYSYAVGPFERLRRFLILGAEGGTYYIDERKLVKENVTCLAECLQTSDVDTVDLIVDVSEKGLAPKNDPAVFALAWVVANGDVDARRYALVHLDRVCRIGTHLFQFCDFLDTMGHLTGRAKRKALGRWYTEKDPDKLAYQLVKYRSRHGWTHRDVLRIAHPSTENDQLAGIFDWVTHGEGDRNLSYPRIIEGYKAAQASQSPKMTADLVFEYGLPREALLTEHLAAPIVWEALLNQGMPFTALIRNLANMTRIGLLAPTSDATQVVLDRLTDGEGLKKARVHPLAILFALSTYASGRGFRGQGEWAPIPQVIDALDGAFYLAFGNVEPTGKRTMLALDISGSMDTGVIAGTNLTPREGAAAMALVTAAVEQRYEVVGFFAGPGGLSFGSGHWGMEDGITPLAITPRQRLDDVVRLTAGLPMGGTDCALPMLYAMQKNRAIDTFIIYTDSETWAGTIHPVQALRDYRRTSDIDAKLVVVGMTSNEFSIADPSDAGMLDVVGFDTSAPNVISEFARGLL